MIGVDPVALAGVEQRGLDQATVERCERQRLESEHFAFGASHVAIPDQEQVLEADAVFAGLVVTGLVRDDHAGLQRLVATAEGRDPLRAFVDVQIAADAVAGAVRVIEADCPQILPRQHVELVAACAGREDRAIERDMSP